MDERGFIPKSGRPDGLASRASPRKRSPRDRDEREGIRLSRLGDVHLSADKYSTAQDYYEQALRLFDRADDLRLVVDTKTKIAWCLRGQGELNLAQRALHEARDLLRAAPDAVLEGRILSREAEVCVLRGDYEESLRLGFEAYEKLRTTDEHSELARVEHTLGRVYNRIGRLEKAREAFEGALHGYRRVGDQDGVIGCLNNLGLLLTNCDRWPEALAFFSKALSESEALGHYMRVSYCALNLGILESKLGRWSDAEGHLNRAMAIAKDTKNSSTITKIHLALGILRTRQGLTTQAQHHIDEAERLASQNSYHRERLLAEEYRADLLIEQGHFDEARRILELALEDARSVAARGDLMGELVLRMARVELETGNTAEARKLATRSAKICEGVAYLPDYGMALSVAAEAVESEGDLETAAATYESALDVLEKSPDMLARAHVQIRFARFIVESLQSAGSNDPSPGLGKAWALIDAASRTLDSVGSCPRSVVLAARIAGLEGRAGRVASALERLSGAALLAEQLGRDDLVKQVETARRKLEDGTVGEAAPATADLSGGEDWGLFLTDSSAPERLRKILKFALRNVRSDRGFLALHERTSFKVESVEGMTRGLAQQTARVVWPHVKPEKGRQICLATDLRHDPRFEERASDTFSGTGSFVALRLDVAGGSKAVLFLDRGHGNLGGVYGEADLRLLSLIGGFASMALAEVVRERKAATFENESFSEFITRNAELKKSLELLDRIKSADATILLLGETGTGKGLLARCIHDASPRRRGPLLQVNCAALPESLLESELFGYVRGAFTGATNPRKGLFEEAAGGTLFLDEVDKTTPTLQAKLLHVLDQQEVRPVGSNKWIQVDARVLCASNAQLREAIEKGEFLEDLYYRLNDFVVTIPPLRDRREDIPVLVDHFFQSAVRELGRNPRGISREVHKILMDAPWRGNVRELEKLVKRMVVLCEEGAIIKADLLPAEFRREHMTTAPDGLKGEIARLERRMIESCLRETGGNKSEAARRLKISYPNLLKKIKILKI